MERNRFYALIFNGLMLPIFFFSIAIGSASGASTVYFNDFQGSVGPEWTSIGESYIHTEGTPNDPDRKFLGQFGEDLVSLALSGLPGHPQVRVSFDLFMIQSWDGNNYWDGPDFWFLTAPPTTTMLLTTFSNVHLTGYGQSYPGNFFSFHPQQTGAVEVNSLGYPDWGDSVYGLTFSFNHSSSDLVLNLGATNLEGMWNESWGIDNINVEVVPIPGAVWFLGSGLVGLLEFRKRLKK